jgi:membrane associated rhomboid family serine protease
MSFLLYIIFIMLLIFDPLPIRDRRGRSRGFPWVTFSLVVINVVVHVSLAFATRRADMSEMDVYILIFPYMEIPAAILSGEGLGTLSVLTAGFLHGGWWHLIGNMFYLWFFGRKVEDVTGPVRFVLLYLLCLYTASLLDTVMRGMFPPNDFESFIPGLGACGAIFGIMAAYMFLYSDQRIQTFIFPIPWLFWLPTWVFVVRQLLVSAILGELV